MGSDGWTVGKYTRESQSECLPDYVLFLYCFSSVSLSLGYFFNVSYNFARLAACVFAKAYVVRHIKGASLSEYSAWAGIEASRTWLYGKLTRRQITGGKA